MFVSKNDLINNFCVKRLNPTTIDDIAKELSNLSLMGDDEDQPSTSQGTKPSKYDNHYMWQ